MITGSREIFEPGGRHPSASVNYVCSHDGFTLDDLVSYNDRHNEANGENNQDGHGNLSWNCGAEGPTDDVDISSLRARQKRNLIATLLLSQGVPMILMGDEISRSQKGNNNAFCQDNETSWLDWNSAASDPDLLTFTAALLHLRRRHEAFRRRSFLSGELVTESSLKDVYWLAPEAREMTPMIGTTPIAALGVQIGNDATDGERFCSSSTRPEPQSFHLHESFPGTGWVCVFDTRMATGDAAAPPILLAPGGSISLELLMLFQHAAPQATLR